MAHLRRLAGLVACITVVGAMPARADVVTDWNARAVTCSANRPSIQGLLDLALVQAAVHDAVQAIHYCANHTGVCRAVERNKHAITRRRCRRLPRPYSEP